MENKSAISDATTLDELINHKIVSRDEWLEARKALLVKEKELTRAKDLLNQQRKALPWVKVDKQYVFDGPVGKQSLSDLFEGRSQLIVNHFMFGPGWTEGCVGCSFGADHMVGALVHLEHHDVSFVTISRAPLEEIEPFHKRMGWKFRWLSSYNSDFNFDFNVSFPKELINNSEVYYNFTKQKLDCEEMSGMSVFYKDLNGDIFHTYSCYARGGEEGLGTYVILDCTPKGRNETGPNYGLTDWVRHHDRYDHAGYVDSTGRYQAEKSSDSCCHSK